MALDFTVKDVIHKITAKFAPTFLPEAKKPYYLRAMHQPELDIHGIASKADVYNIETAPKVIEDGFTTACELIYYLAADGYKIKTPLFNLRIRLPGEYNGAETSLAEGLYSEVRMQSAAPFRQYIRDRVQVQFDGVDQAEGLIVETVDEHSGQIDEVMTIGNLLTIRGYGLKIEGDKDHKDEVGLWFDDEMHPAPCHKGGDDRGERAQDPQGSRLFFRSLSGHGPHSESRYPEFGEEQWGLAEDRPGTTVRLQS
jgi:hypothetical protein